MHVTVLGCPGPVGGARVESGHTILLWRRMGIDVTVIPTGGDNWRIPADNPWMARLDATGCRLVEAGPLEWATVPGLAGGIVSAWCNGQVSKHWAILHALGCRLVWSPCMCYTQPAEDHAFMHHGPPAAVHFQSRHQESRLAETCDRWNVPSNRQFLIRGALELADFPFRPLVHRWRWPFHCGRLARAAEAKWPQDLWQMLSPVRSHGVDLRVFAQGWSEGARIKAGSLPPWAVGWPQDTLDSRSFLAACHALLCVNGGDEENWPRVGLEAMAAGVPVIAEKLWGWPEMIDHGVTGLLCHTPADVVDAIIRLEKDADFRMGIVQQAREAVERLTAPENIGACWRNLFRSIGE
jgi:hypothetical protein